MKNLEERIQIAQDLITRRKEIDDALALLFGGGNPGTGKKPPQCSVCGMTGHTARSCPDKEAPPTPPDDPPDYQTL